MDRLARKVATLVLAKDYFIVKNVLAELQGETIEASALPFYENVLQEAAKEYLEADGKLQGQLTPGQSNPRAAEYGKDLQRARKKGSKARARVEVAKWLQKSHIKKIVLSGESSGDFLVLRNPQEVLDGETIEASNYGKYKVEAEKAEKAYDNQKAKNQTLSGRERGQGGQDLARLGREKRKAQARLEAATQLKARGLVRLTY